MGSYRCIYVRKRKFLTSVSYQRTEGVYQIDVILLVKSQHLAQCLMALCSQFSCQIGCSSAELSLNTTFNASISQKVSPLTVSILKEFHSAQNLASMCTWITALRYMGINSMCTINFTQLAFKGSESKAHLCCLTVWQNCS